MAEVDFDTEHSFQPLMLKEEDIVVAGDGLHLWIPLLHAQECSLHVPDRYRQDTLQEFLSDLAVNECEHEALATPARNDEVALHVAEAPPFVDRARSFIDHALAFDALLGGSMTPFLFEYLRSV